MAPAPSMQCQARTKSGTRCKNQCQANGYCRIATHACLAPQPDGEPMRTSLQTPACWRPRCLAITTSGEQCKHHAKSNGYCGISSHAAQMDPNYSSQIVFQEIDSSPDSRPFAWKARYVDGPTSTRDGRGWIYVYFNSNVGERELKIGCCEDQRKGGPGRGAAYSRVQEQQACCSGPLCVKMVFEVKKHYRFAETLIHHHLRGVPWAREIAQQCYGPHRKHHGEWFASSQRGQELDWPMLKALITSNIALADEWSNASLANMSPSKRTTSVRAVAKKVPFSHSIESIASILSTSEEAKKTSTLPVDDLDDDCAIAAPASKFCRSVTEGSVFDHSIVGA